MKEGWSLAKEAIRFSVNFLRSNAGIEDETLLSSPMLVIVPGFYAWRKGFQLDAEDEEGLKRWLFIANAKGHYSGASETVLDADLNIIMRDGSTAALISSLKVQLGRLDTAAEDFVGRGQQSGLFPIAYLALKARGAKDWQTGLNLSLSHQGKSHFIEAHHIFPKALLKKAGFETSQINEIANMAFVAGGTNRKLSSKPAEEYLAEIDENLLEKHCIPLDRNLWKEDSYEEFLKYRRAALSKVINDFISSAGVGKKPLSFDSLLADGESDSVEFKASARWDFKQSTLNKALELVIAKTIAGFLNADGGVLLIGVNDDSTIAGLERDYSTLAKRPDRDGYQQFLVTLISNSIGKVAVASTKLQFIEKAGQDVCMVTCAASPRPVYVEDASQTRFFVRSGNTTQELTIKDANDYISSHWTK